MLSSSPIPDIHHVSIKTKNNHQVHVEYESNETIDKHQLCYDYWPTNYRHHYGKHKTFFLCNRHIKYVKQSNVLIIIRTNQRFNKHLLHCNDAGADESNVMLILIHLWSDQWMSVTFVDSRIHSHILPKAINS